jgi:hypothetical protein
MKILERMIQYTDASAEDILAKEKLFEAIADRVGGFPPKLKYRALYGKEKGYAYVWDRIWNSMSELEAAYDKLPEKEMAEVRQMPPNLGPWYRELYVLLED